MTYLIFCKFDRGWKFLTQLPISNDLQYIFKKVRTIEGKQNFNFIAETILSKPVVVKLFQVIYVN